MTDTPRPSEERLDLAALLRAGADDELSAHDERRLEAHLETNPEDVARLDAERQLRQALARSMSVDSGETAPAGLRDRIASAMAAVEFDDQPEESIPESLAAETRSPEFWSGTRGKFTMAAAAAFLLVASAAIVFQQFSPTSSFTQTAGPRFFAERTAAASFVAREHSRCFTEDLHTQRKFTIENPEALPSFTGDVVGTELSLADLIAGGATEIEFVKGGKCGVPSGGPSMHLRFRLPEYDDVVSLFIQRDQERMGLSDGVTYVVTPDAPNSPNVFIWSNEGLNYFLVVEKLEDCGPVRKTMECPSQMRNLADSA
ncbi:MAG: hypothetical protein Phyf2KO_25890 [Phycisphaerales bacterium]